MSPAFCAPSALPRTLRLLQQRTFCARRPRSRPLSSTPRAATPAAAPPAPPLDTAAPHVLYIVSTPIGNVGDLTARAARILASVDVVAAEDTRRAGLLLARVLPAGGRRAALLSCHAHNWRTRAPDLVARLRAGASVAVVCDAGTPAVSDPGAELAAAAVAAGLRVVPVPGACAALAALVCAALPPGVEFVVVGFLPRSGRSRTSVLARVHGVYRAAAVVLYEAPHRVVETLDDLAAAAEGAAGGRTVCIAREVTKKYEEIQHFACAADAVVQFHGNKDVEARLPRGEYTIVLGPEVVVAAEEGGTGGGAEASVESLVADAVCDARSMVVSLVHAGTPTSAVAKAVSGASTLSRKTVYAYASQIKDEMRAASTSAVSPSPLSSKNDSTSQ